MIEAAYLTCDVVEVWTRKCRDGGRYLAYVAKFNNRSTRNRFTMFCSGHSWVPSDIDEDALNVLVKNDSHLRTRELAEKLIIHSSPYVATY